MKRWKRFAILLIALVLLAAPIAYADTGGGVTIDLTPIVQAVIALMATIITIKVIPWLKARLTAEQYAAMTAVTRTLVYAAEQLYGAGKGSDKIDYVVSQLIRRGYKIDRDAIEAQVRELTISQEASTVTLEGVEVADKPPGETSV